MSSGPDIYGEGTEAHAVTFTQNFRIFNSLNFSTWQIQVLISFFCIFTSCISRFNTKMDPHYSAQDVARCDICKTTIAQSYCDFCHVNLCNPCIGEHISDEYDKHKIVPIHKRKSILIYPKCGTHPNKTCKYQCKDCNISICSDCIVLKQHNKEHKT